MSGLKEKIKELEKLQEKIELVSHLKEEIAKLALSFNKESKLLEKSDREEVQKSFTKFTEQYVKLLEGSAESKPAPAPVQEPANPAAAPKPAEARRFRQPAPPAKPDAPIPSSYRRYIGLDSKANINGTEIEGKVKNITGNAIVFTTYGGEVLLLKPDQFIPPRGM